MPSERHKVPPPRERTFAELFPWRNIRIAVMLLALIVAIVMIKRSAGSLLARVGNLWGSPGAGAVSAPANGGTSVPGGAANSVPGAATWAPTGDTGHRIRLGPGLAPQTPRGDEHAR